MLGKRYKYFFSLYYYSVVYKHSFLGGNKVTKVLGGGGMRNLRVWLKESIFESYYKR